MVFSFTRSPGGILRKLIVASGLFVCGAMFFGQSSASAAATACGINTGNKHAYAGIVIETETLKDDGTWGPASGSSMYANINTDPGSETPAGNVVSITTGETVLQRVDAASFYAIVDNNTGANCPTTTHTAVILRGDGTNGSPNTGGSPSYTWALDCDISRHSDHYQTFTITMAGKPDQATRAGTWSPAFHSDGTGPFSLPNGSTRHIVMRYTPAQDWTLTGYSTVSSPTAARAVSINATPGQKITFYDDVKNNGPSVAKYQWYVQNYTPSTGWTDATSPSATVTVKKDAQNPSPATSAAAPYTITIPASATAGQKYCQRIYFSNATGPGTAKDYTTAAPRQACATVAAGGTPTVTISCSASNVLTGTVNDTDHVGPYKVSFSKGATSIAANPTTGANGSYSVNVSSYSPAGQTFTVTATGKNAANADTGTVTASATCGSPPSTPCPTSPGYQNINLSAQNVPASTGSEPPASGYDPQPSQTFYHYQANGNYKITAAVDQYGESAAWTSTAKSTNSFKIDYTNYITDYPYDSHNTTVTYDTYYDRVAYRSATTKSYGSCDSGDALDSTKHECTKTTSTTTSTEVTANSTPFCIGSGYSYYNGTCRRTSSPNGSGVCPVGTTKSGGTCYSNTDTQAAASSSSCNTGDSGPNYHYDGTPTSCTHYTTTSSTSKYPQPYYGYAVNSYPAGSTTDYDSASGTTTTDGAGNPIRLDECYNRSFTVHDPSVTTVSLSPNNENPNYASGQGDVLADFGYPAGDPATSFRRENSVTINFTAEYYAVPSGSSGDPADKKATFCTRAGVINITGSGLAAVTDRPGSGPSNCSVSPSFIPPAQIGDLICVHYTFTPTGDEIDENGVIKVSNGQSIEAFNCSSPLVNQPYVHFSGGDVFSGGSFNSTSGCSAPVAGKIETYVDSTGDPRPRGSSVQLGALSIGPISGFSSASLRQTTPPLPFTGLTFANTSGGYGGSLGGSHCIPSYYTSGTDTSSDINDVSGAASGSQHFSGNQTLDSFTVPVGNTNTVYVNGDVYITGDVKFDTAGWAVNADGSTNIPAFYLIVKGNIYIAPGVTQLDGVYISQGNGSTSGVINTCADSFAPFAPTDLYARCNSQLTVNGSFIANTVRFRRAFSSLRHSTYGENTNYGSGSHDCDISGGSTTDSRPDCATEIFNLSPELFLSRPDLTGNGGGSVKYDYIKSLSPVL
jgi:hypothetical protein